FCAVTKNKEYLGGVILAGLRISMEALEAKTSKLPSVEIIKPEKVMGKSTVEGIQSGLYFGNVGMIKEITSRIAAEVFSSGSPKVIGTGGFASLFKDEGLFHVEIPDLVLQGLDKALTLN